MVPCVIQLQGKKELGCRIQLGPSLACQPKAPTSECLLPSFLKKGQKLCCPKGAPDKDQMRRDQVSRSLLGHIYLWFNQHEDLKKLTCPTQQPSRGKHKYHDLLVFTVPTASGLVFSNVQSIF